jgi:predicted dehydrogenase
MKEFLDKAIKEKIWQEGWALEKKKGIGVIGLHEGRTLLKGLDRSRFAKPIAGCDQDKDKVEAMKAELPDLFYTQSYDEMLEREDVEIVGIYTPDANHGEHIEAAFKAGKDVICTKPLVNSIQDAKRILESAKDTGQKLMVGQSTRFFESFKRQRTAFDRGEIGDLEFADAHYIHRMDWFYEKSAWAATETDWVFLGMSHPLDLLRWYLGPIDEVHAYGQSSSLGQSYGLKGFDIYTVNVRAINSKLGRAMGHYGLKELPTARNAIELTLFGEKGTSLAQYHDMKYKHTAEDGTEICEDPLYSYRHYYFNSEIHGMHYGEFANYTDYFVQALMEGNSYSPDLREGVETFCVMEATRRSAQTGEPVKIDPILREAGLKK